MRYIFCITLIILVSLKSAGQTGPGAMLPGKENIAGWRTNGEIKKWSRDQLNKIAGEESEIVMEYGFNQAVEQNYYNFTGKQINVKVYIMNNSFGSCGLFMRYSRDLKTVKDYGNSTYNKKGEYGFWKHLYYVKLTSAASGDTINEGFRMIAAYIDSKIRSRGIIPEIIGSAEGKTGNVTIFKGPLALSEIYYFSPRDIFFMKEGIAIVNGNTKEIMLKYSDNNEAVRRFSDVAGLLSGMSKFSDFAMIENFSFSMRDRDYKTLEFRVSDNYLNIMIQ